ncbi:glycosyltransferase [Hyphomicrobium methylovorum]|uniref:glycosyltransferase n=1 Tax=Hyphomicrobium methylovorum TaxID=84 RepID=UPI0031B5F8DA
MLLFWLAALTAGIVLLEEYGLFAWAVTLTLPFFAVAAIRAAALWYVLRNPAGRSVPAIDRSYDDRLPSFSVLVPLYQEDEVIPDLVRAMARLDYAPDRLEILFITEVADAPTRHALKQAGLSRNMRIVTVPHGQPKTKPRALNYALQDARGTIVSIFDAEDIPDSNQLRRAAEAFVEGGPHLACVQARLTIYNSERSFFTRQFALEYTALFCGILPALARFRLPIPLGGTSNHFRRDLLLKCGGWDPFNVTEDADLGIRLARLGYEVSTIQSETREEAPARWRDWTGQRTRWIKGWMQTYLVHMRHPLRLWYDLGAWGFVGFQIMIGGMILSILVHPWVYVWLTVGAVTGQSLLPDEPLLRQLCLLNLTVGYGAAILLTLVTAYRQKRAGSLLSVLWLPVYWLAISYAAYRAVFDLIRRPFYWEKTKHGESAGN